MDAAAFTLQNWHHSLGSKMFRYRASAMEMFTMHLAAQLFQFSNASYLSCWKSL